MARTPTSTPAQFGPVDFDDDDFPDRPVHHLHHVAITNIKGIRGASVTIEDGTLTIVSGANGQGKSSFVDAIFYALLGGKALKGTAHPVTKGEEKGRVELTFTVGDGPEQILVTKSWTKGGADSTLEIRNSDGYTTKSPQKVLDSMLGARALDPLAFMNLTDSQQVEDFLSMIEVDVDLDDLDADEERARQLRGDVGRDLRAMRARCDAMPEPFDGLPPEPIAITDLIAEEEKARAHNDKIDHTLEVAAQTDGLALAARSLVERLTAELEAAEEALVRADATAARAAEDAQLVPARIDIDEIRGRMADVDVINEQVRAAKSRQDALNELAQLERRHRDLEETIAGILATKEEAIAAADMPIDGLTFASKKEGLVYQGTALKDCSAAEQRLVACSLAMAGDPQIRLISVEDGSLLDSAALAQLEEIAAARDFHVLIEIVDESGEAGIVFRNGEVVPS